MNRSEIILAAILAALLVLLVWRSWPRLRSLGRAVAAAAHTGQLARLLAPLGMIGLSSAGLIVSARLEERPPALTIVLFVLLGIGATWVLASLLIIVVDTMLAAYDVSVADNLVARRMHTQYRVLQRVGLILIWTIGAAVVLSAFPAVRALGTGLLASAGIVGLVVGLAAQRTIGNFLAGIQIALAQPIRLEDAVVIDGEWGWIEDITTTFVVVKIWDERRLIVPFSRLLEQSFQNWTRTRADLLGTVTLWADYRVSVAAVRQELNRLVKETDLWDGRVVVLQVVDTSERAIQLRALVSAATSPKAWDLRCFLRERLIKFMAQQQPNALPAIRAEIDRGGRGRDESPVEDTEPVGPAIGGLPGEPVAEQADARKSS
jgi:small-conductance mechanosensitive channel